MAYTGLVIGSETGFVGEGFVGSLDSIDATGSAALPFTGSGTGVLPIHGTADKALPFAGSGVGKLLIQAFGNAALPFGGASVAAIEIQGLGAGALPFGGSATGALLIQGEADSELPFGGSGTIVYAIIGSGDAALPFGGSGRINDRRRGGGYTAPDSHRRNRSRWDREEEKSEERPKKERRKKLPAPQEDVVEVLIPIHAFGDSKIHFGGYGTVKLSPGMPQKIQKQKEKIDMLEMLVLSQMVRRR